MAIAASPENTEIVRSACRMCHGVCQVLVHVRGGRVVKVTGDPDSPTSRGYICPKGAASPELLYHPDRVTHPLPVPASAEKVSGSESLGTTRSTRLRKPSPGSSARAVQNMWRLAKERADHIPISRCGLPTPSVLRTLSLRPTSAICRVYSPAALL